MNENLFNRLFLVFCFATFWTGLAAQIPGIELNPVTYNPEELQLPMAEQAVRVTLSFGERLKMDGNFTNELTWSISKNGAPIIQGSGGAFLDFVFEHPGDYLVQINDHSPHNPMECNHETFPTEIEVTVVGTKMVFDFDRATFSSPITTGSVSGLILSVPVMVDSYDGKAFLYQQAEVQTAGIGSNITAIPLESEMMLEPGTHTFKYTLSGGVDRPTYVMFDFIDVNGNVQSFGLAKQIH